VTNVIAAIHVTPVGDKVAIDKRPEATRMSNDDAILYCKCMEQLLPRFNLLKSVFARQFTTGHDLMDAEIVFLQFRVMLEQIAFASLVANKDVYSKARAQFAREWRATKMLKYLEQVNAEYYPQPFKHAGMTIEGDGKRHHRLEPLVDGFLTKDDFVELYDRCGSVLHAQNPFSGVTTIHVGRSASDWLGRIESLIKLHRTRLVTGSCWMVTVPDLDGKVRVATGEPYKTPQTHPTH